MDRHQDRHVGDGTAPPETSGRRAEQHGRAAQRGAASEARESRQRIILGHEKIRKEVSNLLHSQVQSRLIVLEYCLKDCQDLLGEGPTEVQERLANARAILREIIEQDLRSITRQLYPSIIQTGLPSALSSLADRFHRIFNVETDIDKDLVGLEGSVPSGLSDSLRLTVYRLAEEALTNVAKHAHADKARLTVKLSSSAEIFLAVQDDGDGFDSESMTPGQGVLSMRDYTSALGGRMEVDSAPGWGTTVRAWFPLSRG
jgi:signal transduction histidine kinase